MSAIYYDSCGHRGYIFDPSDSSWTKIGATRLNDSMVIIGRDTINISGTGGGTDNSIATGSRTATGNYIQDWTNHWFYLNNLKSFILKSNRSDPNLPLNNKVFNFYVDSTYNNVAMQLAWGLKDQSNSATDSLHFEINSTKDYTYLTHWVAKQQKYVEFDLSPNQFYPSLQMYASGNSKDGFYTFGANTAVLNPQDSIRLRAPASVSGSKMLALTNISGGVGTVVAMDIPTGGSADSTTFATKFGVDTAKANLRTQIAGKQPTGNYITAVTGDVTASGPGSAAATLATVNSNTGTFYNPYYTVNGKGLITASAERIIRTISANTSAAAADGVILCNTASGDITVTITTSTVKRLVIQKVSSDFNKVIISPSSGTIRGNSTYELTGTWESVTIITDGTNFFII